MKFRNGVVTVTPKRDMKKFDAAIDKWRGSRAKTLKVLGFKSTDDFIEAIRGR